MNDRQRGPINLQYNPSRLKGTESLQLTIYSPARNWHLFFSALPFLSCLPYIAHLADICDETQRGAKPVSEDHTS